MQRTHESARGRRCQSAVIGLSLALTAPSLAQAGAPASSAPDGAEVELSPDDAAALTSQGKPKVKLDRLTFPKIPGARSYERHLKRILSREVRQADWGAGKGATIEYRFSVDKLVVIDADKVLRVRCAATGRLPKGKTAKSKLTFSGDPTKKSKLIKEVLAIVARGVIARLAELERARREAAAD